MSKENLKTLTAPATVSLFPAPPWQLINKMFGCNSNVDCATRPPSPPGSGAYRMFGNFYNGDDAILRSLESQGVRRVYPQTYNKKRELKKINFSILANYLDLLDIITRDPSSPKRTEKLDHLVILFINMHHLVNEYRQHQSRDLLREILKYQVEVSSETVGKAKQYLAKANALLKEACSDQFVSGVGMTAGSSNLREELNDFGPDLAPLLQSVLDESITSELVDHCLQLPSQPLVTQLPTANDALGPVSDHFVVPEPSHIDMTLWQFLTQSKDYLQSDDSDVETT